MGKHVEESEGVLRRVSPRGELGTSDGVTRAALFQVGQPTANVVTPIDDSSTKRAKYASEA
jgi:hypothetical protein